MSLRNAGVASTAYIEDVTFVNNFISNTVTQRYAIEDLNGRLGTVDAPGTLTIAGNTFSGNYSTGAILVSPEGSNNRQSYVIKNNIFEGTMTRNLDFRNAPSAVVSDGNVFDVGASFRWNNVTQATLADWRTTTGQDANSTTCTPAFVDSGTGDFHLSPTDTCATNAGLDITSITLVDIDNDTRLSTNADVGADEAGTTVTLGGGLAVGVTEADIVTGSQTATFTLSGPPGDTWLSTLGDDIQCTTDFLNGLDSAQSEAAGWDAKLKPSGGGILAFSDLTRTSTVLMTLVLPAVATYDITSTEIITPTIPACAFTTGTSDLGTEPAVVVVQADVVNTLDMVAQGFITALLDTTSALSSTSIAVNDSVTVTFTYTTTASDRNSSSNWGEYLFTAAPNSLTFTSGTHIWQNDTNFQMFVRARDGTPDQLFVTARGIDFPTVLDATADPNRYASIITLVLTNSDGTTLASDSIPTSLTLSEWDFSWMEIVSTVSGGYYRILVEDIQTLVEP